MKKVYLLIVTAFICLSASVNAQTPNWQWAKGIGGTSLEQGKAITTDASGNVYTTGFFSGTVDFDPGAAIFNLTTAAFANGIFISKLDASGNFVWAKQISGTSNNQSANAIVLDSNGNIYITGKFSGTVDFDPGIGTFNLTSIANADIFIAKLDASGNFVWAKTMGGTLGELAYSIALDPSGTGALYITGAFQGTVDFDPGIGTFNLTSIGSNDIFIAKINSSGNFIWAKRMGGTGSYDAGYSLALEPSDKAVYITGTFEDTVDFDPGAGIFNLISNGQEEIFISKLDSSGNFLWAKQIGGASSDYSTSIALDANSANKDVFLTGYFAGTVDFDPGLGTFNLISNGFVFNVFILKLDSSGNFIWAKAIGDSISGSVGNSIALDALGNVYTTGSFGGPTDFDPGAGVFTLTSNGQQDVFISKLDNSGNFVWAKTAGGAIVDVSNAIALDATGHLVVAGYYYSPSILFGSDTLINVVSTGNSYDIFIAKLGVTTGVEYIVNNNGVLIYPNPTNTEINISINKIPEENTIFILTDMLGRKLMEVQILTENTKLKLDQPNGIYFAIISSGKSIYTRKIIVE